MLTAVAAAESLPTVVVAFGSLAANETVELAFRNSGRISKLDLDLGSAVKKGEIVGALDPQDFELAVRDVEAAVRQARVQLSLPADGEDDVIDVESTATVRQARAVLVEATLTRDRVVDLVERELRPPADLDAAVAAYGVAASRLQQAIDDVNSQQAALQQRRIALAVARRALAESVLVAPFDAEVAERRRRPPEFVAAGESVLRLLDVDPLRLRLRVPEREALRVAIGQVVVFTVDGITGPQAGEASRGATLRRPEGPSKESGRGLPGRRASDDAQPSVAASAAMVEFRGAVVRASPAIDGSDRTLLIEVEVENSERRLRPGLFARASIEVTAPALRVVVPADTVIAFAGVEKVFCVDGDVARERRVRTGRRIGERVEIDDGLDAGAVVVRAPGELVDGSRVVVRAVSEKR